MWVDRETLRAIYQEIQRAALAAVAPFTRGGKLDLSSPNVVGHLPEGRGGTGGTSAAPNAPFVYLTDADGTYLTDADGTYLIEYTTEPETAATSITVEEVDGSPTVAATKLVLPNGTLGVVGTVATYTPSGGGSGLTVAEIDGAPSGTPTTLQFPNDTISDQGGGVYRYTPASAGGADHAYWARKAALLDPGCLEAGLNDVGSAFDYTVSGNTKYLQTAYYVKLGATGGKVHTRDPRDPLALPVGTNLRGIDTTSSAYVLDPGLATPYIADGYTSYHDRRLALDDLPLRQLSLNGSDPTVSGAAHLIRKLFLPSAYGVIVRQLTIQDFAWGGPVADRGGWIVTPEYGDAITTPIREGLTLNMVGNLNNLDHFQAGYAKTSSATDYMTVLYSLLPSDWSDVPDAPDWREDCMGASLDTATKWRRQGSNAAYAQIDTAYQWIAMNGNGATNGNVLVASDTFARADLPALVFDVLPGDHGASAPNLIVGWMTAPGALADTRFRYCFNFTAGGALTALEQNTAGANQINTTVGSYNDGSPYRCRITLAATGATYEIQGGAFGPIGGAWTDLTPGGTQGTDATFSPGMQQSTASVPTYVGNLRVYE